mgnify:FL=1
MEDKELVELAEVDLARLIERLHKSGINYWQILKICLKACLNLQMMADTEWWVKSGKETK